MPAIRQAEINNSGLAPGNDLESTVIVALAPGSYAAVVSGVDNGIGTGVVDAYDISASSPVKLANIATRGLIQAGDKLMIAGFIVQNAPVRAVVRAIGPSLLAFGINNALADTTLQLRDQNGVLVREDGDWRSDQEQELESIGLQPSDNREAALVQTIPPRLIYRAGAREERLQRNRRRPGLLPEIGVEIGVSLRIAAIAKPVTSDMYLVTSD